MSYEDKYYAALEKCAQRYVVMVADGLRGSQDLDLSDFIDHFFDRVIARDPIPKMCRWLGNIQGKLHDRGYTTDDEERIWTRPLFRPLDFPAPDDPEVVERKAKQLWEDYREDSGLLQGLWETLSEPAKATWRDRAR
jgi:hypothetical protein